MVFENIDESVCVHIPNQQHEHNGIEMKLTMDHTVALFDSIQGIVEMLGVDISDILDIDYEQIERDVMVSDWLDKNYPALGKFENDFSLWYHMDIIDMFSDMKIVDSKHRDGNIDKLLIVKYTGYGYILVAPKRSDSTMKFIPPKTPNNSTENLAMNIKFTDSQRKSLAEDMLQCTLRKDITFNELNAFAKAEWNAEAIEAIDHLNDIIDWMERCGIVNSCSETSLKVAKLYDNAYVPEYEHEGDAGFSLRVRNAFRIRAGEQKLIKLGISFIIDDNYEVQIRSRSGRTFKQKLVVAQGTGTIDSGYRGEIGVILYNRSDRTISIDSGESVAQGVLCKLPNTEIIEINKSELTTSDRGNRGYGSTGL